MKFRLYYAGIRVSNLERSIKFYSEILGMEIVHRGTMPHGGKFAHLKNPGSSQMLELNWYPKGNKFYTRYTRGEELDHLAFVVDNVEKSYQWLITKGVKAAISPEKSEGTEVYVKDPDGIWIELLQ